VITYYLSLVLLNDKFIVQVLFVFITLIVKLESQKHFIPLTKLAVVSCLLYK